jgi:molybdopterin-guanine dinucleotide biosynthesis protein A
LKIASTSLESGVSFSFTCGVCVLAGGLSTRLGRDKARLRLGHLTMLGQIRRAAKFLGLPVRVLRRDLVPRCGPIGGVFTGLKTSPHKAELFLACDMPFVSAAFLEDFLDGIKGRDDAVFTVSDGRAGFPFLLRTRTLALVERQIARKEFSLQTLAQALKARRVRIAPSRAGQLFNINTPADLQTARRRMKRQPR